MVQPELAAESGQARDEQVRAIQIRPAPLPLFGLQEHPAEGEIAASGLMPRATSAPNHFRPLWAEEAQKAFVWFVERAG
jgi:hypothetical protein